MREYRKQVRLSKLDYYKTHLSLINCLLPIQMTPKEIEVVAGFMGLEGDIAQYRFGKTGRKIIMDQLKLSPSGLSNYLLSLTKKGFLTELPKSDYSILSFLIPEDEEQLYLFKLIKDATIQSRSIGSEQDTNQTNRTDTTEAS